MLQSLLNLAADLSEPGEPLWTFVREAMIPTEADRKAMVRQAFQFELEAGAARSDEVHAARTLRMFLQKAAVGVNLEMSAESVAMVA